jgi:hypothetical protein
MSVLFSVVRRSIEHKFPKRGHRGGSPKACVDRRVNHLLAEKTQRAKKIRVRKTISKAISGAENGICYASVLCFAVRFGALGSENYTAGFELPRYEKRDVKAVEPRIATP